jgi:hypothetical protein
MGTKILVCCAIVLAVVALALGAGFVTASDSTKATACSKICGDCAATCCKEHKSCCEKGGKLCCDADDCCCKAHKACCEKKASTSLVTSAKPACCKVAR